MNINPHHGDPNNPQNPGRLHGLYMMRGTNPDQTPYSGTVEISYLPHLGHYKLVWNIHIDPPQFITGRGHLIENQLVVKDTDGNLIQYTLRPDGTLYGLWTMADGANGAEILART